MHAARTRILKRVKAAKPLFAADYALTGKLTGGIDQNLFRLSSTWMF
jgi:hypothetical protein